MASNLREANPEFYDYVANYIQANNLTTASQPGQRAAVTFTELPRPSYYTPSSIDPALNKSGSGKRKKKKKDDEEEEEDKKAKKKKGSGAKRKKGSGKKRKKY